MTRVIGPTRRSPFQIGGGASTCLLRNQSPAKAPPAKSARPIRRANANSRARRSLPRAGDGAGAAMNDGAGAATWNIEGMGERVCCGGEAADVGAGAGAPVWGSIRRDPRSACWNSESLSRICFNSRASSAVEP